MASNASERVCPRTNRNSPSGERLVAGTD